MLCSSPDILAQDLSPCMSYYALFECVAALEANILVVSEIPHPFPLNTHFGTLAVGLALSLLTTQLISCRLTPIHHLYAIRSLISLGRIRLPRKNSVLYLHETNMRLALKLFRGEPAISGSIGISPLSTPHRHPFQRMCVRSSISFYGNFNLDMDRITGFRVCLRTVSPFSDLLSLRLHTLSA